MNQLYFMEIEPVVHECVLDGLASCLTSEKKERVARYRRDIDRKLSIFSELLIRCLISAKTGVDYREIRFHTGTSGKPGVSGLPNIEFNVSHTRNAIAAALSDKPVGVDVERVRDIDFHIADKCFSDNERALLQNAGEAKNRCFFEIWTKKEALMKYLGTGLTNDLKLFDVTCEKRRERFTTVISNDYVISACSEFDFPEKNIIRLSEPEFIEMWRNFGS